MKLRYHLDRKQDGLIVLESEPQVRSLFINSQVRNMIRVPLPHMIFIVRYEKKPNGMFSYPGIYGSGLHIYGKSTSLSDFSDDVFLLPTDSQEFYNGMICTNHSSDNKEFDSITKLVNHVITLWWGHSHTIGYQPFGNTPWHEVFLDQGKFVKKISNSGVEKIKILKSYWKKQKNLRKSLGKSKQYGEMNQRCIPDDAKILDLNWPCVLTIADFEGEDLSLEKEGYQHGGCNCEFCVAQRERVEDI